MTLKSYDENVLSFLADVQAMLNYAKERGLAIPSDLAQSIDQLFRDPDGGQRSMALVLDAHARLSALVTPANPESIRASSLKNNKTLLAIALFGFVSFVAFVLPLLISLDMVGDIALLLGASGLGSTFYSLYTATKYLRERTFDPKYNQVYAIRFALGIFAGFILGHFGPQLLDAAEQDPQKSIGPPLLALVGGFSAEAVAQILQRVADTLVTMVRGSGKERAEAEAEKELAKKASMTATKLQEALNAGTPEKVHEGVQAVIREMVK